MKYYIIALALLLLGVFIGSFIQPEAELAFGGIDEIASPKDRVSESQIIVNDDKVTLDIANAQWARFKDTNSMDPFIDEGANAIQIVPESYEDLQVGDVISYELGSNTIIHRIVGLGTDEQGWYAVVKGDNNPGNDAEKVRWSQVRKVLVGVIY